MTDKKQDIIENYTVPAPSEDFADRIIMTARQTPQRISVVDRFKSSLEALFQPPLSYGLASILIIGLAIGGVIQTSPNVKSLDDTTYTFADIFEEDESLLIL